MRHSVPDPDEGAFSEIDRALSRAEDVAADDLNDEAYRPRTLLLSTAFALAVVVIAAVVAYGSAVLSVDRAAEHTDERVAVLESDLQQRRSAAAEQNARRDEQLAELQRLVCVFANHADPRDADVEDVRARYGCANATPSPTPGPSRTATAAATARATAQGARRPGGGPGGPGVGGVPRASNAPTLAIPSAQVPPAPAGSASHLACIDVMILPKICL